MAYNWNKQENAGGPDTCYPGAKRKRLMAIEPEIYDFEDFEDPFGWRGPVARKFAMRLCRKPDRSHVSPLSQRGAGEILILLFWISL